MNVEVRLMPWRACTVVEKHTDCPMPVVSTKTVAGGKFVLHAHPGHYLLVIGSNTPVDHRATIHDPVYLKSGGRRQLSWPVDDNYLGRLRA
jgi:hypothetical protein